MRISKGASRRYVGLLVFAMVGGLLSGSRHQTRRTSLPDQASALTGSPGSIMDIETLGSLPEKADNSIRAKVNKAYAKLPLSFEANQGQTDSSVKFISRTGGQILFLTSTEAVLSLRGAHQRVHPEAPDTLIEPREERPSMVEANPAVLRMRLLGANPTAKVIGVDELPGKSNYFIGNDPQKWQTNISNYARVRYESVYQGVDLVYYGNQSKLEYDLILGPGADPGGIQLAYDGAKDMRLDEAGDLVFSTESGEVRQHKPIAYQEIDHTRRDVPASYRLDQTGQVGIAVAAYDTSKGLVIDPVLSYSTFLGSGGFNGGVDVAVDGLGNAYLAGDTGGAFPITPGALNTIRSGQINVFVAKLNPAGSGLVYSTFFGGDGDSPSPIPAHLNEVSRLAVDTSGNAYVTGFTNTTNFPTTPGCFQNVFRGFGCGFASKLNQAGSALVYSTYLGGSSSTFPRGIAVDALGEAYVTGFTASANFPITAATAFQPVLGGGADAFLTKFGPFGGLLYSTYLGGAKGEIGIGVAADDAGNAYITGATQSTDFPTSPGAFQTSFAGGTDPSVDVGDVFVTKLSTVASGSNSLIYSTYLGGSGVEGGRAIAVDSAGNAFVTGVTQSLNFPTTQSVFQNPVGGKDAFVTKLDAVGTHLIYSTYLGGTGNDEGNGIAIDNRGNACVVGHTFSTDLPTVNAFQTTCNCGVTSLDPFGDAFLAKLNHQGTALSFSSYLGGAADDIGFGIAVDASNSIYVTGYAKSTNFPTTPGAYQTEAAQDSDTEAFVTKLPDPFPFDACLQDDSNGSILRINTVTGNYQFVICGGLTLSGTATITRRGCLITLQVNGPDLRLQASIDTCRNSATASVQVLSQGRTFTIVDRNTANNPCACPGH